MLLAVLPTASADTFNYSTGRRQVRVGIVVSHALDVFDNATNLGSENPDPHVFYVLNSRNDLKPLGFEFVNPVAPAVITSEIYKRWQDRQRVGASPDPAFVPMSSQATVFTVGSRVTKNMGAYWEVNVDTLAAEEFRQFDLLYIHSHKQNIAFGSEVREKLRRFVDAGGTLFVENCGRMTFSNAAPFLLDVANNSNYSGAYGTAVATPNHPLLSYPFILSAADVQRMGDLHFGDNYLYDARDANNPVPGGQALAPVVWNTRGTPPVNVIKPAPNWRPMLLAGIVGAGRLVFSMHDVGCRINDFVGGVNVGYGGNSGAISGESLLGASPIDLKFGYNLAAWSTANSTGFMNSRRNGQTDEKIGSVLADKWTNAVVPGTFKTGGAVYYKNCIFAVDGALVLHCYDAKPEEDLDGDGNPDDGIPDLVTGAPLDEVWRLPLLPYAGTATGASTPTIAEFYDPNYINAHGATSAADGPGPAVTLANFDQRELVIVTMSDGTTLAVRAFPRVAAGSLPMAPKTKLEWAVGGFTTDYGINNNPHSGPNDIIAAQDLPIPGPVWSEGIVFVAVNTANGSRIVAIDPRNGQSGLTPGVGGYGGDPPTVSMAPDVPNAALMPAIIGSPSVGYVRDGASGAIDEMVYVHTQRAPGGGGVNISETVRCFWFGTKGEPLTKLTPLAGQPVNMSCRADKPWFLYDPGAPGNGNPLLRQRIWFTFTNQTGAYFSTEMQYDPTPGPAPPNPGFYKLSLVNNQVRVLVNAQQMTPLGLQNSSDPEFTFYADYTIDWVVAVGKPYKITPRSVFAAPEIQNQGQSQIGGPPAISPEDLIYYNVATVKPAGVNPGAGVLFGVNEQFLRTTLKWAFTMHDGFNITVNGLQVPIPPRLRQMDPLVAANTGTAVGDFLVGVQFFGTPAYRDGVIYAVARGNIGTSNGPGVSVLCAFKANPELVLRLPAPIDPGTAIRIRQVNIVTSQGGLAGQPTYVELSPGQYTIDYQGGLVRITSCAPPGTVNNFVSTSVPFLVQIANAPEQLVFGSQVDQLPGNIRQVRMKGPEGIDNLLWYAVIPAANMMVDNFPTTTGFVASSPSLQADNLWLGFQLGYIASFPADPAARDPNFQSTGNQVTLNAFSTSGSGNLWVKRVYDPIANANANGGGAIPAVISAPAANANVMVANTFNGVAAMEDTFTIIADSTRLIEVNAAGDAVWSCDSTKTYGIAGGDLPFYIYDPISGRVIIGNPNSATGAAVVKNVAFAKPTVARRIGTNDLLVVDTGNNRIVQIDRGGNVIWEVSRLFDNYRGLLRPGDPTSLNEPTDVQFFTDFNPNVNIASTVGGVVYTYTGPAYIVHYLISDTGNNRVIELIDAYGPDGQPIVPTNAGNPAPFSMLRQLNFASSSYGIEGNRFRYRSVQRLVLQNGYLGNLKDPNRPDTDIRLLTLSAISNARLIGTGNVAVNPDDPSAAGQIFQAEAGAGSLVVLNENGNPLSIVSNLRIPTAAGFRVQAMVNPTWFSAFIEGTGYKYLLADDNGCYQMVAGVDPVTNQPVMNVEWLITTDDYYRMTGKRLKPASVRRLVSAVPNGQNAGLHHFLIANRFSGEDNPSAFGVTYNLGNNPALGNIRGSSEFHGEAFELNPTTFTVAAPAHGYVPDYTVVGNFLVKNPFASIVWRSPTEILPRIPALPAFAGEIGYIRRVIGDPSRATSSNVLQQPAYADRPF